MVTLLSRGKPSYHFNLLAHYKNAEVINSYEVLSYPVIQGKLNQFMTYIKTV
jgi:hypothetical protein